MIGFSGKAEGQNLQLCRFHRQGRSEGVKEKRTAEVFSIYFKSICAGQRKALQQHREKMLQCMNKFIHAARLFEVFFFFFINIGAQYAEVKSLDVLFYPSAAST